MSSITIKVNDDILKKMEIFYEGYIIPNKNQYVLFTVKIDDCTITAYNSNKVLFQGNKANLEASIWTTINENKVIKDIDDFYTISIGSDEVGTGDYFGPVVVVATYLEEKSLNQIKKLNIDDSKKISDDEIIKIAPTLFKLLPYSLLVVNNEKYNEVMSKNDMNLNKLKAILHKQAITNLLNKINKNTTIIIDQFCSIDNFNKYINDNTFSKKINFHTKAESKYASVACASMMARYIFLQEFEKLSEELKMPILKGASNKVDIQGKELVNKYGPKILNKVAKIHFKNTDKILN